MAEHTDKLTPAQRRVVRLSQVPGDPDAGTWGCYLVDSTREQIVVYPVNAKLVAAAPRLLHCCQCVLDGYEHPERDGEFDWVDMACELREAIKEATEND